MEEKRLVKKKKDIPFHIAQGFEKFIHNGVTFWAKNKKDADRYIKKIS